MNAEQQAKQWGQIVAKAWQDDEFKKRLLAEPATVFKEFGVAVPAGVQVRVVENTDQILHLALPPKPQPEELSDEDLTRVAGGYTAGSLGCVASGGGGVVAGIREGFGNALLAVKLAKTLKELPKETGPKPL